MMAGPLGSWLREQATMREEAKEQTSGRRFKVLLFGLPLLAFLWILLPVETGAKLALSVMAMGLGFGWAEMPKIRAVKKVKIGINEAIAEALGLQYEHDCEAGTPFELAKSCRLVPNFDRARFEDKWSGTLGGRNFAVHEAKLEERRGSGKNRRWVTVFRGVIMSVALDRDFHGTTVLVRDRMHRSFWGGRKDSIDVDGIRLDYAEMSHPEFEDAFDIYSSDQVEARYLIHPLYVERLIALEQSYSGQDVATIFHRGDLVVALKSGNMFESGSIEASDDRQRIERTVEQFSNLVALAESLRDREERTGA